MSVGTDGWQFHVSLTHLYRDAMRIVEQQTGMSQTRLEILHELYHADELSQAQLQQHLGVEGAVVTRIIKQLEAMGLVTRRPDPHDNRYTLVAMSEMARRNHAEHDESLNFKDTFGTQLMDGLSEEDRANLLRMMGQIQENAKSMLASGSFAK